MAPAELKGQAPKYFQDSVIDTPSSSTMADGNTFGGSGPSSQPSGSKRPGSSPLSGNDSAKKPMTFLGARSASAAPSTTGVIFGSPSVAPHHRPSIFPSTPNSFAPPPPALAPSPTSYSAPLMVPSSSFQPGQWASPSTANKATYPPVLTPAQQQDLTNSNAEDYLDWLKQLDLQPPEGIINWKKAEITFTAHSLVNFGNLELILVTKGCLHLPRALWDAADKQVKTEHDLDFFQEIYRNECVELVTSTAVPFSVTFPRHLLPLGSVYSTRRSNTRVADPPSLIAHLYIDISKPSKSLWLVTSGFGEPGIFGLTTCECKLAESVSVKFDIAKLVDDVRTLGPSAPSGPIMSNEQHVVQTFRDPALAFHSADFYHLAKPDALELEEAIRKGWSKDGFASSSLAP
ncbi:hypothetical protein PG994_009936 [Apiospora phragmitis]|uniref:Uncharacterized protein n=1 Tax=Apiospora phragmitis TaxID=2905665 RepID=A0ABR1TNG2_9PEZI